MVILVLIILTSLQFLFACDVDNILKDDWGDLFPNNDNMGRCRMKVHENSAQFFRFKVLTENANLIHLKLNFTHDTTLSIQSRPCVIQPYHWIWTYNGDGGASQYLNWPMEYGVWSLGLLNAQTIGPIDINIKVAGDCRVHIGTRNTTGRIGMALMNMTSSINNRYYKQSYFCFKERIAMSEFLYALCHFITCPVEAAGYKCCHSYYCKTRARYVLSCPGQAFRHASLWWFIPFLAGFICYLYVPIILFRIAEMLKFGISQHRTLDKMKIKLGSYQSFSKVINDNSDSYDSLKDCKSHGWIFESPVSVGAIISRPFRFCFMKYPLCSSRAVRFIYVIMTMSVIALKIAMHGIFQREFIIESVKRGVPLDFLSVYAGYDLSKMNFLIFFGGPYVACGLHLLLLIVLLCVPKDLSSFYEQGLPNNPNVAISALNLDITTKLRFGSVSDYLSTKGYRRIGKTMKIHFVMILNSSFWKHVVTIQKDRWKVVKTFRTNTKLYLVILYMFVFPCYVLVCVGEALLCIVYYGFPVLFWLHIVLRAYNLPILKRFWRSSDLRMQCVGVIFVVVQSLVILFVMYIFNIVFVDSVIFISRLVVFTYTGLFAYPAISFSYVIFGFSVIMYGMDSIKSTGKVYRDLYDRIKSLSKIWQENNPRSKTRIWMTYKGYSAIPKDLFQFVLDRHRPIRIEVFLSMLKIFVLMCTIYISVTLLQSFKTVNRFHTLTESLSTLFVCFIPKLLKEICVFNNSRKDRKFDWALEETIKDFRIMKYQSKISITPMEDLREHIHASLRTSPDHDQNREEMSLLEDV